MRTDEADASEGEKIDDRSDKARRDGVAEMGGAPDRERDEQGERKRAEQAKLVPDLEQDGLRRARRQQTGELAAQGGVEPMAGEQSDGLAEHAVAPDLPRLQS